MTEARGRKTEVRSQSWEVRDRKSETGRRQGRDATAMIASRGRVYDFQVRSMNVVSTVCSAKAVWLKMSNCRGIVVLIPSIRNSRNARCMVRIASSRVAWWTISLPIIES